MLSYPFIEAVLQAVLKHSKAIQGRVYWAPFFGSELNSANLEQIVKDSLGTDPKKYPLSIIIPPLNNALETANGWETYMIRQLFLKRDGATSAGDIQDRERNTNRSLHTIVEDWHDMRRAAVGMLKMISRLNQYDQLTIPPVCHCDPQTLLRDRFRVSDRIPKTTVPVTRIGNDKLSGVMITYGVGVYERCDCDTEEIEDYGYVAPGSIVLPDSDIHPEHQL